MAYSGAALFIGGIATLAFQLTGPQIAFWIVADSAQAAVGFAMMVIGAGRAK